MADRIEAGGPTDKMPAHDSARLRQLEQERDAAIAVLNDIGKVLCDGLGEGFGPRSALEYATFIREGRRVEREVRDHVSKERDDAVAACAAKNAALFELLQQGHPHRGSCCTFDSSGPVVTADSCCCEPHEKRARAALSTAPGARLLEERRHKAEREKLLDAFVAAWDTKRAKHEHEVHAARDALLRFDEGGEGEAR